MDRTEAAKIVLNLLRDDPEGWKFDQYHAVYLGQLDIWIENRPYGDLAIGGCPPCSGGYRLGRWWQWRLRRKIRAVMDSLRLSSLIHGVDLKQLAEVVALKRMAR